MSDQPCPPPRSMPSPANLRPTPILDHEDVAIRALAVHLRREPQHDQQLLQSAHRYLVSALKPVYTLNELQPASSTLRSRQGSCSQRMACLEAMSRACDIATRVRVLHVSGQFWYPRFRLFRAFIPKRVLLVWPQFFFEGVWTDFDELYNPAMKLAENAKHAFINDGESIFDGRITRPSISWRRPAVRVALAPISIFPNSSCPMRDSSTPGTKCLNALVHSRPHCGAICSRLYTEVAPVS